MPHLLGLDLRVAGEAAGFPFDLPALAGVTSIEFDAPVTILVGENGSGKSTLLEAIAIASRSITAGSAEAADDPSLAGVRALADALRLRWRTRTGRGFYLRAEDFFGYARRIDTTRAGLEAELERVDVEYADREAYARDLARSPIVGELAALDDRYGPGLDARSHGEAFLAFFGTRLVPRGLYLLDEPEAPLSPSRQLAFLALLKEVVRAEGQVIMATHSPILLAFPGARILGFDDGPIHPVRFADLEHVTLTRDFLADPEAFLRHL